MCLQGDAPGFSSWLSGTLKLLTQQLHLLESHPSPEHHPTFVWGWGECKMLLSTNEILQEITNNKGDAHFDSPPHFFFLVPQAACFPEAGQDGRQPAQVKAARPV